MRLALRLSGTLLMVASILGLAALSVFILTPDSPAGSVAVPALKADITSQARALQPDALSPSAPPETANTVIPVAYPLETGFLSATAQGGTAHLQVADPSFTVAQPAQPITHVDVPAIGLSADVVPAALIQRDGSVTWEVPAFKIGHAETTADAGQPGNAVLFGHVTSLRSGNVFANLDQVKVGQAIHVFADSREFDYTVVSTSRVPRTDSSGIGQNDRPVVSLITCAGIWLPTIWDYTERLVVRAELDQDQNQARGQVNDH